jgi:hypothetical protein
MKRGDLVIVSLARRVGNERGEPELRGNEDAPRAIACGFAAIGPLAKGEAADHRGSKR